MLASRPRGSRIVYVASSARELPADVQEWLGRPEIRAASSPNIYDCLAILAGGARPTLLIVSIEAVDWNEMEFFDQAVRLSRHTRVYAVGQPHQLAKLEAAFKRGARRFDPDEMAEELSAPPAWSRGVGVSDILAASLRNGGNASAERPPVTWPARSAEPTPAKRSEPEPATDEPDHIAGVSSSDATPPPVRLLTPPPTEVEIEAESETDVEPHDVPIPFPWSPAPNRPQRVPPRQSATDASPPGVASGAGGAADAAQNQCPGVELTADELAALMGRPVAPEKPAREGFA